MNTELQTIPISSLYESAENSRHVFDERKLKELAQSKTAAKLAQQIGRSERL